MKCLCGCDQEVKPGNKFISGHNSRMKEYSGGQFEKGYIQNEEMRKKRSITMTGRKGTPCTEENKRKISEVNKGNKYCLGFKHSEEAKKKMSEWHKNKTLSIEHRRKIGEANKRRVITQDTKDKLKTAHIGRIYKPLDPSKKKPLKDCGATILHDKAFELFGKESCEHCNLSNIDSKNKYRRRLDMHNIYGNHKIMKQDAWMTLCMSCHHKLHKQ